MELHRTRVALLVGGPSSEHEISLLSGEAIRKHLDKKRFNAIPILIDRKGEWPISPKRLPDIADVAFVGIHGEYGEDGVLQEILQDLEIPYTGSDPMTSALVINKPLVYRVLQAHGIKVPNARVIDRHNSSDLQAEILELPVVVKPVNKGASAGVSLVRRADGLKAALERAFAFNRSIMIEDFIPGLEFSCGVMDDGMGNVFPLPVVSEIARAGVHLEHDHYRTGIPREIRLIGLPPDDINRAQAIAVTAHQAVGASGVSRTHMIFGEDGELYVLGVNTIPEMAETSFLSRAAQAHGLSLAEMFERLIEAAFIRHQLSRRLK
ncbi:MAG: ATP-grasp domain-containing protein [Candidatus Colwellbacteria bacterium]|nr:ATP-grasp domain-containing protein [Candidatus Colwellbacteria bacterium]